ncbi:MAG: hypothetical protein HQM14_09745, partial [SAR324 cluster bacterium]|nr:hypothetical protein [SAR324 cluster bacterium]
EESPGEAIGPKAAILYDLDINCLVIHHKLEIYLRYNKHYYQHETIEKIGANFKQQLKEIIHYCMQIKETHITPSDIDYDGLNIDELDEVLNSL